jgi:hypothetical protein
MNKKFSTLQLNVLRFYREGLKHSFKMEAEVGLQLRSKIREDFRKNQKISRLNMNRIEYLLRLGKNKFEMVKASNVTGFN